MYVPDCVWHLRKRRMELAKEGELPTEEADASDLGLGVRWKMATAPSSSEDSGRT